MFLVINPIVVVMFGPAVAGWLLVGEFIFTLAMALKCYPLLPGGLLAVEALLIGMTTPEAVYHELLINFPVILLLMFMVAGIYFMKELLLVTFTQILVGYGPSQHFHYFSVRPQPLFVGLSGRVDGYRSDYQCGCGLLFGIPQGGLGQGLPAERP